MQNQTKPVEWEKVYIFISSTFNDMHAERDYLVKRVFPKLSEWCEKRKLHMVDVDLRWGVTEADATQNRNVVNVCFNTIDKCRPFFICFLGQRYGWIPCREDISDKTFEDYPKLEDAVNKGTSLTELEIIHSVISPFHSQKTIEEKGYYFSEFAYFYLRDDSYLKCLPDEPSYLGRIYSDAKEADEQKRKKLQGKIEKGKWSFRIYDAQWLDDRDTPEIEIPLKCPAISEENMEKWREKWSMYAGVHVTGLDVEEKPFEAEQAKEFNQKLTKGRLANFKCNGEEFGDVIYHDIIQAIGEHFPDHKRVDDPNELQKEIDQQEQFIFINSEGFIKRTGDFKALDEYVKSDSKKLFVLTAEAGMGKSTLLANWMDKCRTSIQTKTNQSIHFRSVGASDGSTTVYSLLRLLFREIKEVSGKLEDDIPDDPQKLRNALPELLEKIGQNGKTVIVIDAINQLETGLSDLTWLPRQLPENIKLIVSFTRGEKDAEELYNNFAHDGRVQRAEVKPFEKPEDRWKLVEVYLLQYLKELDKEHIGTLIDSPSAYNPLYLKVVLSELRVFGAFDSLGEKIRTEFGDTPLSAFEGVLYRLEHDPAYSPIDPKEAVPLIFGLLAHARNGLSGEELTSLLIQALDNKKRMEDASDTVHFFLRQVRHFLARRDGRYDFFYESFKNAALKRYVSEEDESQWTTQGWNKILADYFYGLPLWGKSKSKEEDKPEHYNLPNHRKVSELPYHQAHAMLWDELEHTLTDLDFLEAKVWAVGPQLLIDDYEESYQAGYKGESLRLYQKALRHEANILSQRPDLVWQQLYNRLQWAVKDKEDGLVARSIDKEYKIRSSKGALPWVHQINKVVESETLTRTLVGHTSEVNCCAFSPTDGKYIVSGSSDGMRLWETATGKEMATLKGHQSEILSCCFSPNGKLIVSGGSDGTLRLWEMTPFKELTVLEGSFGPVYCCAFSPTDGKYIVSGSSDGI